MLLTLVGALFEAAGVGLIVPFIAIITSDNFQLPISFANTFPFLDALSPEEIIQKEIPTGTPYIYDLSEDLEVKSAEFIYIPIRIVNTNTL